MLVDEFDIDVETMIPVALIINEVLTNSYKHAFKGMQTGSIKLSVTQEKETVILTINDNGIGFQPEIHLEDEMLGVEIIKSLVEQLNGTFSYESDENGAAFTMTITL